MSQIRVELQLEDRSFVSGVWRAGQSLRDFKQELARTSPHFAAMQRAGTAQIISFRRQEETTRTLGQRMRDLSIIAGGLTLAFGALSGAGNGMVGGIIRINAEMERLKFQLSGMSTAADPMQEATQRVKELQEMAATTPFSINELSKSFVKMTSAGLKPAEGHLRSLTDALASFGASDEHLHRVTIALTQMQGKGVLSMEELRQQLGESMPNAMQLFARSMNLTVGQLAKLVSSGTVESTSSITRFLQETQRSYAGSGAYMMQSYSGLMARIRTEFTKQVTGGEMETAFNSIKKQMGRLAEFLTTQDATDFFDTVGRGAQAAMAALSDLTGALVSVRDYFAEWGSLIIKVFAGVVLIKAISAFVGVLLTIRASALGVAASYNAVTIAATAMTRAQVLAATAARLTAVAQATATSANTAAAAAATLAARAAATTAPVVLRNTAGAMGGLIAAGGRFLGLLGPIALTVGLLAPVAWEVGKGIHSWATGAKDAATEIEKANSRIAESTRAVLDSQQVGYQSRLDEAIDKRDNPGIYQRHNRDAKVRRAQIVDIREQELKDFLDRRSEMMAAAAAADAVTEISQMQKLNSEKFRLLSRDYNSWSVANAAIYQNELNNAKANNTPVRDIEAQNRERLNEARLKLAREQVTVLDEQIARLSEMTGLFKDDPEVIRTLIGQSVKERSLIIEEMKNWKPEDYRVELLIGVESEDKKIDRMNKAVETSKEKFRELQAELGGASGELAKLMYQIDRGDYGNMEQGTEAMLRMRDSLVETTVAVEVLDKVLKNLQSTQTTLDRIESDQLEERLKLQAEIAGVDTTREIDFVRWKLDNGILEGMGDPNKIIEEAIKKVTSGIDLTQVAFEQLGLKIRDDAFGAGSVLRIDQTALSLTKVRDLAGEIRTIMTGSNEFMAMPGFMDAINGGGAGGVYKNTFGQLSPGAPHMEYQNQNSIRNKPIQSEIVNGMAFLREMGITMLVQSGGQDAIGTKNGQRVGTTVNHDHGNAADVRFRGPNGILDFTKPEDNKIFQEIVRRAMANGLTSFGAGTGYMGNETMHVGLGAQRVWGKDYTSATAPEWLKQAAGSPSAQPAFQLAPETQAQAAAAIAAQQDRVVPQVEKLEKSEAELEILRKQAAFEKKMRDLQAVRDAQTAGTGDEKQGTNQRKLREEIEGGDYAGIDPKKLQEMIDLAVAADKHLTDLAEKSKTTEKLNAGSKKLEDERRDVEQRRMDALAKAKDPNYVGMSAELKKLLELEREQLALAEQLYGLNSVEYKAEQARINQQRNAIVGADSAEAFLKLTEAARDSEKGAITDQRVARQQEFERRVAELAALRDQAIADGMLVAQANILFEQAVANERKRLLMENRSELSAQLDQMSKFGESINKKSAGWAQGLSDAIYDSFNDPDAFKNFANSIREGIARSLTDAAAAAIMKPFENLLGGDGTPGSGIGGIFEKLIKGLTGGGAIDTMTNGVADAVKKVTGGLGGLLGKGAGVGAKGAAGGAGKGAAGKVSGKAMPVGVKHTGGIVGRSGGLMRSTAIGNFIGAPKFHTGGIVGGSKFRSGLNPSEVPIIAQKGEGVFTADQMKHLGGNVNNRSISINAPVTVNANGGTPDQNADLARQMAEKTEKMFRGIVQHEMLHQMRPGGMLK